MKNLQYDYLVFSIAICALIPMTSTEFAITLEEFDTEWDCSRLCTDSNLASQVPEICAKIAESKKGLYYEKRIIKQNSECKQRVEVQLSDDGNQQIYHRQMAMCYLGKGKKKTKCISAGQNRGEIIVYDFDSEYCIGEGVLDNYLEEGEAKNQEEIEKPWWYCCG